MSKHDDPIGLKKAWMAMEVRYGQFIADTGFAWPSGDDGRIIREARYVAWHKWLAEQKRKEMH